MKTVSLVSRYEIGLLVAVLIVAAVVRLPGLVSRSIWYDEAITLLETAGHASPTWPQEPTFASVAKRQLEGAASFSQILEDLRHTDIHPPVYYWLLSMWRERFGFSLEIARAFSLLCSIGTLLVFYILLRTGGFPYPLVPTTVYALSTSAVHFGYEARSYALGIFFIIAGALLAYVTPQIAPQKQRVAVTSAFGIALCCGVAFQTNYLSLFPLTIILLWFGVNIWPFSWLLALCIPSLAVAIFLADFSTFLWQLSARPQQFAGFVGPIEETSGLLRLTLLVLWAPSSATKAFAPVIYGGLAVLGGLSVICLLRHWREVNQKWWLLFFGLATAPPLGIACLDFFFAKHLYLPRYVMFAGPALVVFVSYSLSAVFAPRCYLGSILLAIVVGVQLLTVNWGSSTDPTEFDLRDMRHLARTIQRDSSSPYIVVIGAGSGRGTPGALVYELAPQTMIFIVDNASDLDALETNLGAYKDVWVVLANDSGAGADARFLNRLEKSGLYEKVAEEYLAVHLRRNVKSFGEKGNR